MNNKRAKALRRKAREWCEGKDSLDPDRMYKMMKKVYYQSRRAGVKFK